MPIGILSVTQFAACYSGTDTHNPLCWFKTILAEPMTDAHGKHIAPAIPKAQYTVQVIRNTNVLCYGNANPFRAAETAISDAANLALFTMVGAIDLTASNFGPFGGANTKDPIPLWRHENATPELGIRRIYDSKYFKRFHMDQLYAVDTIEPALFAPANKPVKKNLAGHIDSVQPGTIQVKFPPTFVAAKEPVAAGSPIKRGAVPVEDSDSDDNPAAPVPGVFHDMLNPGPIGTLYPPDQMPEYKPGMLETRNVKLMQYAIRDEEGELIHPAMYYDKFTEGQVVEVVVSMEGMHLAKDIWGTIRVHSLRMLKVNPTDYSKPPVEPPAPEEEDGEPTETEDDKDVGDGSEEGGRGGDDAEVEGVHRAESHEGEAHDGGGGNTAPGDLDKGDGDHTADLRQDLQLEAAGLTDNAPEGDVEMVDGTASAPSTSAPSRKRKSSAQEVDGTTSAQASTMNRPKRKKVTTHTKPGTTMQSKTKPATK